MTKYTILMNGKPFIHNKYNTIDEVKSRLFTCSKIFKHSIFVVTLTALTINPNN